MLMDFCSCCFTLLLLPSLGLKTSKALRQSSQRSKNTFTIYNFKEWKKTKLKSASKIFHVCKNRELKASTFFNERATLPMGNWALPLKNWG